MREGFRDRIGGGTIHTRKKNKNSFLELDHRSSLHAGLINSLTQSELNIDKAPMAI